MAAFAASPMAYHNFALSAPPLGTEQAIYAGASPHQSRGSEFAAAFPLLLAALPELAQAAVPDTLVRQDAAPLRPLPAAPNKPVEVNMRTPEWARTAERRVAQPPSSSFRAEQTDIGSRSRQSPSFQPSLGNASTVRTPSQDVSIPPPSSGGEPPMATVFRILNTTNSPFRERTEIQPGMKDIFSRL
jgi:hypothetical protein